MICKQNQLQFFSLAKLINALQFNLKCFDELNLVKSASCFFLFYVHWNEIFYVANLYQLK